MKKLLVVLVLVLLPLPARPTGYVFAGGAATRFNVAPQVMVPNVLGLTSGLANLAITGAGLITGTTGTRCSTSSSGLVVFQTPVAGVLVNTGSAVDYLTSTGVKCKNTKVQKLRFQWF